MIPAAGNSLGAPWIHEVGLTLAMILGAIALGKGILEHGFMMPSAVGGLGLGVMAGAPTLPHDGTRAPSPLARGLVLAVGHPLHLMGAAETSLLPPSGRRCCLTTF